MRFLIEYIDQLMMIVVGVFIAINPSMFVKGFSKSALKTQTLVRIMGIILAVGFAANIIYLVIKK